MRILAHILSTPVLLTAMWSLCTAPPARAVLFPVMTEISITSCSTSTPGGGSVPCAAYVNYAGHTAILDIGQPTNAPLPLLKLDSLGIHCQSGDRQTGFSKCNWNKPAIHSPHMSDCTLKGDGTWSLVDPSACVFSTTWGAHNGAGPGAECVVYGQYVSLTTVNTPNGAIDATQAANSGNRNCAKPLPPNTPCTVQLVGDMHHGVMQPHGQNRVTARGSLDCGATPSVILIGPSELPLAEGVTTHITVSTPSQNEIVVTSDMTTVGAHPGTYSANAVIAVSPQ